jgi:hypothetical protein
MGLFCLRLRKPLWENGFAGRPQVAYSIVDGKDLHNNFENEEDEQFLVPRFR